MLKPARVALFGALAVAGLLQLTPVASGQCFGPDNLDNGPCCGLVNANLPDFTLADLPGLGICWDQCNPTQENELIVKWDPLTQVRCGQYITQLTVVEVSTGNAVLFGQLHLDYTRTWIELDLTGREVQVWRLVAKIDFMHNPIAGMLPPCPVPSCLPPTGPENSAFFYGYVDYAQSCGTPEFSNTLVLYHACDLFIHGPISSAPGVYHPGRAYAVVAPHSPVQQFIPGNTGAPAGPLVAEAQRNVTNPMGSSLCTVEDPIRDGALERLGLACMCTLTTTPQQHTLSRFVGQASCVNALGKSTNWSTLFLAFPTLPWPHLVNTSLGRWNNPLLYPGEEFTWASEGLVFSYEECADRNYVEAYYGAMTDGGWDVTPALPPGTLTNKFLDLADNWTTVQPGPHPLPWTGKVMPTDHLFYVNVP